jgi:hypothetical protein
VTTATHIRPVPADLPVYPIGAQDRLDGNSFVKWNSARWMASRTAKLMSWDQQGMHRYLFDACQMETPVGTLPDDDRELAAMLRTDAARIREIRGMEFGALGLSGTSPNVPAARSAAARHPDLVARALALHDGGATYEAIGRAIGLSWWTVKRMVQAARKARAAGVAA